MRHLQLHHRNSHRWDTPPEMPEEPEESGEDVFNVDKFSTEESANETSPSPEMPEEPEESGEVCQ